MRDFSGDELAPGHAYHVHVFAAFELHDYTLSGKTPFITAKFLRWVAIGGW